MVAPHSLDAFLAFTRRAGGEVVYNAAAASEEEKKGLPPNYELAWNHTTLRALRVDPAITYLQLLYPFPDHMALVEKIDETVSRRGFRISNSCASTATSPASACKLVRFTTEERLDEIIRIFEENGCPIFNPHRYTLEEGGMKQTDEVQLAFKREADPQGLLNPGKMIAWENPDYDYRSGKTFLFKGLKKASLTASRHENPRPPRPSRRDKLQCRAAPADRRAPHGRAAMRSTTATSMPRIRSPAHPRRAACLSRRARPAEPRRSTMSERLRAPKRWCFPSRSGTTAFRRS